MMRKLLFLLVFLVPVFFSCSPEEGLVGDQDGPVILVYSPTAGQTVGETISVTGRISDASPLRATFIQLYKTNSGSTNQLVTSTVPSFTGQIFSGQLTVSSVGQYLLRVFSEDTFGNSSASDEISITVDAIPVPSFNAPLGIGETLYTNLSSFVVNGTTSILGGISVTSNILTVTGASLSNVYTGQSGTSWGYTVSLEEGDNTLGVISYGGNDTVSQRFSCTVVRDTVAPSLTVDLPTNGQKVGERFNLQGTASDALSGMRAVFVKLDDSPAVSVPVGGVSWNVLLSNVSGIGLHTNYIYGLDCAGNFSATNIVVVERAVVPFVYISDPADNAFTLTNQVAVGGTAGIDSSQAVTNVYVRNNGGSWVSASGAGAWTLDALTMENGTNVIEAKAVADNGTEAYSQKVRVLRPEPSSYGGMGSILHDGGATFRVWAPNATSVSVAGEFNSWNKNANYLASEGGGYWSVFVPNVSDGQQYKYVIRNSGNEIWRNDPYAREVSNSVGNSIVRDRNFTWSSFNIPGHHEMVIYEMHVHTWTANISGSLTKFAKVASKAGWLANALSVNAVEILPVAEFPGDQSWGYNPAHPFAVESSYGGYLAYKQMVDTLHQNGIAVIQDVVHNHYGPSDLDLWCFDGPDYGNGGIYFYTDYKKETPWGDTRPDYGRDEVRSYIKDNAVYWIEEMNCDGLRWDATVYIHRIAYDKEEIGNGWTLLQWCNNEVYNKKADALTIAEDLQNNNWVTKETGEGGLGFRSQWYAKFLHDVRGELTKAEDSWRDMDTIAAVIGQIDNGNHTRLVKYTESHDECAGKNGKQRLLEDIAAGDARGYWAVKRAGLGLLAAIFSPGIPMLFQGQENLEYGNWDDTVNFSWDDVATYTNHVAMIGDAIRLKRNWNDNTRGLRGNGINVWHVNNTGKVIAFHRWMDGGAGDDVVVIINFSNTTYSGYSLSGMPGNQDGKWTLRFNSGWSGYMYGDDSPGSGDAWASGGTISFNIGGYSVLVYSQ